MTSTETVTALPPTAGRTQARAIAAVPLHFQPTDAVGAPIPDDVAAGVVAGECGVHVSVVGAQVLEPTCARYDPIDDKFHLIWTTARQPKGQVTVVVTVASASHATSTEIATFTLV